MSGAQTDEARRHVRRTLSELPAATFSVNTFLTERIDEVLTGYRAGIVVGIFGTDLDALDEEARQVASALRRTPGAEDVQIQAPPGMPQVEVRLRPTDVARWGFDPVTVLEAISTAFGGDTVAQVYEASQVVPVSIIQRQKR